MMFYKLLHKADGF
jgi:hypothetical protein